MFISKLKQFGKLFLQLCEKNIVSNRNGNTIEIIDDVENNLTQLQFQSCLDKENAILAPADLLEFKLNQLEKVLLFLSENLFKFNVYIGNAGKHMSESRLMSIFSDLISKEFVKLIYEQLIISIIPLENFDFQLEAQIRKKVGVFEANLKQMKFLDKKQSFNKSNTFNAFTNNVEELYVKKKCKHIIEISRELMKQQDLLFEPVWLDERQANSKLMENSSNLLFEKLLTFEQNTNGSTLDELNLLQMPKCSVSVVAKRTIELVYETLDEALELFKNAQNIRNVALLCLVARNIFDLYANVIPTYHRDNLLCLPSLAAIAYNDLVYLAYNCLTLTHQYKTLFLQLKQQNFNSSTNDFDSGEMSQIFENFSCLDLIPKLCWLSNDILNTQIEKQKLLLMQFLNEECNGVMNLSEGNNYELLKKALQMCIMQLNKLANMWIKVLPKNVYCRVFGQFFNFICADLLKKCLKLEDITCDDSGYLHAAFSLVNQSVYEIFSKEQIDLESNQAELNEYDASNLVNVTMSNKLADLVASKYINTWLKFNYLLQVLKANLQNILDLWSDSHGPLAQLFEPEEVRHLIRALFSITDKRSAVLAKIK